MNTNVDFETLLGKVIVSIDGAESGSESIVIKTSDGANYTMYHEQDCCESVYVEDIIGDIGDLVGSPLTMAEEAGSDTDGPLGEYDESYTWTFYKLATVKGYVTIRWYGTSNGYYSESVRFVMDEL